MNNAVNEIFQQFTAELKSAARIIQNRIFGKSSLASSLEVFNG